MGVFPTLKDQNQKSQVPNLHAEYRHCACMGRLHKVHGTHSALLRACNASQLWGNAKEFIELLQSQVVMHCSTPAHILTYLYLHIYSVSPRSSIFFLPDLVDSNCQGIQGYPSRVSKGITRASNAHKCGNSMHVIGPAFIGLRITQAAMRPSAPTPYSMSHSSRIPQLLSPISSR